MRRSASRRTRTPQHSTHLRTSLRPRPSLSPYTRRISAPPSAPAVNAYPLPICTCVEHI
ncbi:hypothetical protein C8R44DRAFT_774243 [Mycena epipterygia]|nr:hypothetical protein C8R44DRAFT_774243 [Mycena epipterygia]